MAYVKGLKEDAVHQKLVKLWFKIRCKEYIERVKAPQETQIQLTQINFSKFKASTLKEFYQQIIKNYKAYYASINGSQKHLQETSKAQNETISQAQSQASINFLYDKNEENPEILLPATKSFGQENDNNTTFEISKRYLAAKDFEGDNLDVQYEFSLKDSSEEYQDIIQQEDKEASFHPIEISQNNINNSPTKFGSPDITLSAECSQLYLMNTLSSSRDYRYISKKT